MDAQLNTRKPGNRQQYDDHTEVLSLQESQDAIRFVDESGQEQIFKQFPLVIGRSLDCDWILEHRGISRRHAEILLNAGQYVLHDLNSLNGVRVNGFKIDQVMLEEGDQISLGDAQFTFHKVTAELKKVQRPPQSSHPKEYIPQTLPPLDKDLFDHDQMDLDDLDLDDLYHEDEVAQDELPQDQTISRNWRPILIAILISIAIVSALLGGAYYVLKPNLGSMMGTSKVKVNSDEPPPVMAEASRALDQLDESQDAVSDQQEAPTDSTAATDARILPSHPDETTLDMVNGEMAPPSSAAVAQVTLPALTTTHVDLPEAIQQNLAASKPLNAKKRDFSTLNGVATRTEAGVPVIGPVKQSSLQPIEQKNEPSLIPAHTIRTPEDAAVIQKADALLALMEQSYISGDETKLGDALRAAKAQANLSSSRRQQLRARRVAISRLLVLYQSAYDAYQSGDKQRAFTLWSQFLPQERSWLGNRQSYYAHQVTQSVISEYFTRAQQAEAAGDQVRATRYRQQAEALGGGKVKSVMTKNVNVTPSTAQKSSTVQTSTASLPNESAVTSSAASNTSSDTNTTASNNVLMEAEALYQKGIRLEYVNLDQALAAWRQVVQMVPSNTEPNSKAAAKLAWYEKWRTTN